MDINTMLLTFAILANGALIAAVAHWGYRSKRWILGEIYRLKKQQSELQLHLVAARKEIVLTAVNGELRLPAMMPSQNGEDVLIHRFFEGRRSGFFVEVGAYDGVAFSNTYFLEALGWDGVLVEPTPRQAEACRRARPNSRVVEAACGKGGGSIRFKVVKGSNGVSTLSFMGDNPAHEERISREGGTIEEIEVAIMTLDEIVGQRDNGVDLLSIDVEGAEVAVLESVNLAKLAPELIVLEDNGGGADSIVEEMLAAAGYRKDFVWTHNVFYVRQSDPRRVSW